MAGLKPLRRKKSSVTPRTTRSTSGKDVIFTVTTSTGTVRVSVPRGSLDLPEPAELNSKR